MRRYHARYVTHRGMPRFLVQTLYDADGKPTEDLALAKTATVALPDGNFQRWEVCPDNIEIDYYH